MTGEDDSLARGAFVTLEGGEGAGKSTSLRAIGQALDARDIRYIVTREPGGTRLAESIRELLLEPTTEISALTELMLMFAARYDHVEQRILPALQAGQWVICDRFVDASFAYQCGGRQLDPAKVELLESWIPRQLVPDLTLLLDVPAAEGLARATRGRKADRFEQMDAAFYERVRQAYLERARDHRRFTVINASQPRRRVVAQVVRQIESLADRWPQ